MAIRGVRRAKKAIKTFLDGSKKRPREPQGDKIWTGAPFLSVSGGPKNGVKFVKYKSAIHFNLKIAMCTFVQEFLSESCDAMILQDFKYTLAKIVRKGCQECVAN